MQTFITASETRGRLLRREPDAPTADPKLQFIKEQIRSIIISMPNQQTCEQTAINIGLPISILQFDKLLKLSNAESNINSLQYTLNQLKTLQKEALKLKNKFEYSECKSKPKPKYIIRQAMKRQKLRGDQQQLLFEQKKIIAVNQKMRLACEKQLEARLKIKKWLSTDCEDRKDLFIKKKAQTAKSMNKKAFKIFKNYKEKHEKEFQCFKIQVIYDPNLKKTQNNHLNTHNYEKAAPKLPNNRETFYEQSHSQKYLLQGNWMYKNKADSSAKCMTAVAKVRSRYRITEQSSTAQCNIDKQKQKYSDTISKRQQLQRIKEEQAIQRYIKKQQKIIEIRQKQNKGPYSGSTSLKKQKIQQLFPITSTIESNAFFIDQSNIRCQQKQLKKDMQLHQRVNRMKQQFKAKEQRQERHRLRRQKENEQRSKQVWLNMMDNTGLMKELKEGNQMKREMIIKKRYQQQKANKKKEKLIFNIHKYSDSELKKLIQEIRLKQKKDFTNSYQAK